jgi:nucleoid-associated protein YgaU
MDRNVTASFGLSVLIVTFFAVALYQPDPPPAKTPTAAKQVAAAPRADPRSSSGKPHPLPAYASSSPEPATHKTTGPADRSNRDLSRRQASESDDPVATRSQSSREAARTRPVSRVALVEERSAFTEVRAGETLDQVARRVYGDGAQSETLWRVNRDLLETADTPVRAGMLLRTP